MERLGLSVVQRIIMAQRLYQFPSCQTLVKYFSLSNGPQMNLSSNFVKSNVVYCPFCDMKRRQLHQTAMLQSAKARNTKKKLVTKVQRKVKKTYKLDQGVATVKYNMTVAELAAALGKDVDHVFECMVLMKTLKTDRYDDDNSVIDNFEVIQQVCKMSAQKYVFAKKIKEEKERKDFEKQPPPHPEVLTKRRPVVTIMGHVDHGKTTLLDALRHSHIVDEEFGGITQHIGAFSVKLPSGEDITFLDTPGHAAFSAMRARGAYVTDIVVLVVAADDGVMQQTVQSVEFARDAGVPIIVAINKCDKPEADIEFTKRGLMGVGLTPEDVGGDVQCVPISALKQTNLSQLQEAIVAQAEVMDIKADPVGQVEAVVIESKIDHGRGKLATALVQRGTITKGKVLIAGTAWAKVRGMFNEHGQLVREAGPGVPVQVIGWKELPHAGAEIYEVENEYRVREIVKLREGKEMELKISKDHIVIKQKMDEHYQEYARKRQENLDKGRRKASIYRKERVKEKDISHKGPEFAVVIKGDVDGSVEAIMDTLDTYDSDQCYLHILSYGTGGVSEHDVDMAASFNGIIYAFNTSIGNKAMEIARSTNVKIKEYNVIYKMVDDIREELTDRLEPMDEEKVIGEANVLQAFTVTEGKKKLPVAGCRCVKGSLNRKKKFKLIRDEEVLFDGSLSSLRHFKNEVETIKFDVECGMMLEDKSIQPQMGDTIVCYELVQIKQELDWPLDF